METWPPLHRTDEAGGRSAWRWERADQVDAVRAVRAVVTHDAPRSSAASLKQHLATSMSRLLSLKFQVAGLWR
jgi:hypothetical protein